MVIGRIGVVVHTLADPLVVVRILVDPWAAVRNPAVAWVAGSPLAAELVAGSPFAAALAADSPLVAGTPLAVGNPFRTASFGARFHRTWLMGQLTLASLVVAGNRPNYP